MAWQAAHTVLPTAMAGVVVGLLNVVNAMAYAGLIYPWRPKRSASGRGVGPTSRQRNSNNAIPKGAPIYHGRN
jgi:hypothetical protein